MATPSAGPDAVVVGSGPNGLVAANILADAGWDVLVLEAGPSPGGGVSSAGYLGEGYVADVCSAFYPLAAASPALCSLHLEDAGLEWCQSPAVLAHPLPDGRVAVLQRDVDATIAGLDALTPGDGTAWGRLYRTFLAVADPLLAMLFTPFPPLRAGLRLWRSAGAAGLLRLARSASLPVRRLAEEELTGAGSSLLLAGCALHADLSPESAGSSFIGWLLAMLGQYVGFPVPRGGARELTAALVRRLERRGGHVSCATPVSAVLVEGGRARGVRTLGGATVPARRAVLADVPATTLYGGLVAWEHLPARLADDLSRFQWDWATVKVDWALDGPVPWSVPDVATAATVHLADDLDEMTRFAAELAMGEVPARPFVVMGQMAVADPSRAPAGGEVVWAYTHVPRRIRGDAGGEGITGKWDDDDDVEAFTARIEARIEQHAPGFRRRVVRRHVLTPSRLEAHDANLVGGAINGGTSALHQQLLLRPTPGLGRPETPVGNLYLASSSAHPGGGVHGACGANAARAALRASTVAGRARAATLSAVQQRLLR